VLIVKEITQNEPRPFLRWAGGKNWLIKRMGNSLLDLKFNDYYEPFLGGASLFFYLKPKGNSYLSDLNADLIDTYSVVKGNVGRLISEMEKYKNTESFYYSIRGQLDNKSKIRNAAKFIYLNQTSFNGIYRVNLCGVYNVPYGFRSKKFLDEENLRLVSSYLKNVVLRTSDFSTALSNVKKGDLVFLDPPYTVSHNNNGFIKYNQKLFSLQDQYRLAESILRIKEKGAYYILTNAAHKKIAEIFGQIDKRIQLNRSSLIGGVNAQRGQVSEYVFTNISNLL
jgi:DNA adenine methylase